MPCNAAGLSLWSRQPFEPNAKNEFDSPLAWRFDETDTMVLCDNVKVPWERVFVMDDAVLSREIYIQTPSHCYGNHQSNVRLWSKLRLIVGLASRLTQSTGADQVPAVREVLGRLTALEATLGGMIHGQIEAWEPWPEGFATFNRRYMYAALNWGTEVYSQLIDILRELSGGRVFQIPASVTVMHDPAHREIVRDLLADAAPVRSRLHEIIQAGLGIGRFRIRRPASAIREIVRRRLVHRPQPQLPRSTVGRVPHTR